MLLTNATLATMVDSDTEPYGLIEAGAIALSGEKIAWAGPMDEVPQNYADEQTEDLGGRLVTPAFIDCHTHIVHGGNRAKEFEMRLEGASYEEVARAGGGIVSTVAHTRAASKDELVKTALPRLDALISEGVSCVEVKSGYGLDKETELRMLRAARALESQRSVRIRTTFLGAHAVPKEFNDNADAYIDTVCIPALHAACAEGLVDAVDGFCEGIAFTSEQVERVFQVAKTLGLPVKLHAEQLSNIGGTQMAARNQAISVDHIEYANESDVKAMANAGCVAVLLPGAFYTLGESQLPPLKYLRQQSIPIALATDCNPGSSPLASLLMTMNFAFTLFKMTPEEALAGVTRNAAKALKLNDCGTIESGKRADLSVWDIEHPAELAYRIGFNPLYRRYFRGQSCVSQLRLAALR